MRAAKRTSWWTQSQASGFEMHTRMSITTKDTTINAGIAVRSSRKSIVLSISIQFNASRHFLRAAYSVANACATCRFRRCMWHARLSLLPLEVSQSSLSRSRLSSLKVADVRNGIRAHLPHRHLHPIIANASGKSMVIPVLVETANTGCFR